MVAWIEPPIPSDPIYVASGGSDSDPGTESQPLASIESACQLALRQSRSCVLVHRGHNFSETIRTIPSGSPTQPFIISSYGGDQAPQPVITDGGFSYDARNVRNELHNVIIDGLTITAGDRSNPSGIRLLTGICSNITIQDCTISGYKDGIVIQDHPRINGASITDVVLIGNRIMSCWSNEGHSQGLFARHVRRMILRDNFFDHNGWTHDNRQAPSTRNHNVYLKECLILSVFQNIFARGSSFGTKLSSDSDRGFNRFTIRDNLYLQNGNTLSMDHSNVNSMPSGQFSHYDGMIRGNVFEDTGHPESSQGDVVSAFGVWARSISRLSVTNNFYIQKPWRGTSFCVYLERNKQHRSVSIRDNTVHIWNCRGRYWDTDAGTDVTVEGNTVDKAASYYMDPDYRTLDEYPDLYQRCANMHRRIWANNYSPATLVARASAAYQPVNAPPVEPPDPPVEPPVDPPIEPPEPPESIALGSSVDVLPGSEYSLMVTRTLVRRSQV